MAENEQLKMENQAMRSELSYLRSQLDKLESQSRQNNLHINGITGTINESWSVCESKVREFIKDDLDLPDKESVEIERVHRVKSQDLLSVH